MLVKLIQYDFSILNYFIRYGSNILNKVIQYVRISRAFNCNQYDENILNWSIQYVRISMFLVFISMIKHTELTIFSMFESVCLYFQFSIPKHTELENILNWKKLGSPPPLLNTISKHTESEFQNPIQKFKKWFSMFR